MAPICQPLGIGAFECGATSASAQNCTAAATVRASQAAMRIMPPEGAADGNDRCPAKARMVMSPENSAEPAIQALSAMNL